MSDKVAHRYDIACGESCNSNCGLERAKDGEWIAFEDYEVLQKKLEQLRQSLEATVLLCKYNCCAASHCGRCRVALEALGEIDEYGEVIGPNGVMPEP